ncbi:hypothetical protein H704_00256 [Bartonella bacilliformis Peru38]|uniref:Uncharacterized protein n=2 Tax=Bartonella bacilliformis TaxID=774 RepID=A1URK3_BARBK|nr:hypothetical protein [Bartonella bacilliformis]ABM44888.1 hypothetical protein BARBAKC583_0281 [Bartonella bacilliformis KC583]AMG85460.1 hypothetical protein AL467_01410 [Bartonella bacilliformis]EKS45905.1 hypothetical protein BbINS_01301 [Bartonella bacilliformis INS]EYS90253.1 hypothetical protein X472_00712 [Bartonella bacilliformis San Pedro600-02]KEG20723.1 hypothetical protein H704_00256 [Bartonella bacilliformis Peru38]
MNSERKPLDFAALDEFKPKNPTSNITERKKIDKMVAFPSREQSDDAQINIKTSTAILNRFRTMAKQNRYHHGAFLEVLMNAFEQGQGITK